MTPAETLAREQAKAKRESLEMTLAQQFRAVGLSPEREHRFHDTRKWRFDFAFVEDRLAVECDGGTHTQGRHTRAAGYAEDCRKMAEALLLGWRVLRVTGEHVKSGEALRWVQHLLMVELTQ